MENETRELLSQKSKLKESFSSSFLYDLNVILEKCFLMPKHKKEHFISQEKLEVDFIKLLQSHKKFSILKNIKEEIKELAIFDNEESIIGRILSINVAPQTVEFENMYNVVKQKNFTNVTFFNISTLECMAYFDKQKMVYDSFNYRDTYRFLMNESILESKKKIKSSGRCETYNINSFVPTKVNI